MRRMLQGRRREEGGEAPNVGISFPLPDREGRLASSRGVGCKACRVIQSIPEMSAHKCVVIRILRVDSLGCKSSDPCYQNVVKLFVIEDIYPAGESLF